MVSRSFSCTVVDDFFVAYRFTLQFTCHVIIVKATEYVQDICFADVSKKFIAQSFAFTGSLIGDIHDFYRSGCTIRADVPVPPTYSDVRPTVITPTFGSIVQKGSLPLVLSHLTNS